jgi:SOS regulatory protein LexA
MNLTPSKKRILDFVDNFQSKNQLSPSIPEIAKKFKLANSTVHQHLTELKESGFLNRQKNQPRSISTSARGAMVKIPLLGLIAAGEPIEAIENRESIIVPKNNFNDSKNLFALKVKGESMTNENIDDGDTVIIRKQNFAKNGDKVVALINGNDATLKTFYQEKNQIRLEPANKNFKPILINNSQDFAIQGVLIDIIKTNEPEEETDFIALPNKESLKPTKGLKNYLNKVYNGDVFELLRNLPDNSVDTVFGDPDYNVGIKYGDNNYTKKFDDYINWYTELTKEAMRVLKGDGNLFMMNYPQQNAHLRVKYLDSYFPYVNEYVWVYNTNVGHTPKRFTTAHRSILHVRKKADNKFYKDEVALPYKNPTDKRIKENLKNGSKGRMPYSWFEFNLVKNVSKEKTNHACQIPQKLTEMLIKATTKPKDIVFILFGGSGAEIDVCKNLNRQFVSAEIDKKYCDIINKRLETGEIAPEHKLVRGKRQK